MAMLKKAVICVALALPAPMFMSCTSTEPKTHVTSSTTIKEGVPGGTFEEKKTTTATVKHIDSAQRRVTLEIPDGRKVDVKCGSQVANFDRIRVGDRIKMTYAEELVVSMAKEGTHPARGGTLMVAHAPEGAEPRGLVAGSVEVTATVTAIDRENRKVTLKFPQGSLKTVTVRKDVDLTQRKVGEKVVIRKTEALAFSMEEL